MPADSSSRPAPKRVRISEIRGGEYKPLKFATPLKDVSIETLEAWTKEQQLPEWDVLLIGDGSGSYWQLGCGWCCVLIDKYTKAREVFWGGMNRGTVPIGEIMAYVHAMLWYEYHRADVVYKKTPGPIRVLVVCDNDPLVKQGNKIRAGRATPATVGNNNALWHALMSFQHAGFDLRFHWIERVTIALNRYADKMASNARLAAQAAPLPVNVRTKSKLDVYKIDIDEHEPFLEQKTGKRKRKRKRVQTE